VDRDLVELARAGDRDAFAILVHQVSDRLFAIAFRILRDVGLAEDALQNALLTTWTELPQLRDVGRFEAWSRRILVHGCYAEARRKRRWTDLADAQLARIADEHVPDPSGDGGPALEASLTASPYALAAGDDDSLFFSEWQRSAVRRIDPSGIITTVAGGGTGGDLGDCGPATEASLMEPQGIAWHDGVLYIVDAGHDRIRVVVP
jgi:DNA-directed RNA polymerase specialized sigma24 family protein